MCGIAGFTDSHTNKDDARANLHAMLESIAHRGPDSRGVRDLHPLWLGHNRLSIIDLSEDGNQPMEFFDAVIVYNGEIYNYKEIRKNLQLKGYIFKTESDTEVILAAYREYGENCVEHFVGMWAFAIWDLKEEYLFCSRDRFGIKPFYYIHENDRFYFGSEYRALKCSSLFTKELNWNQVSRGLQLGWITYEDETYFKKIKSLPAACNLIFSNGKTTIRHYWDLESSKSMNLSFREKCERFHELFSDSIRLHMRSDVEVGACLSGGLDSSSIVSSVARNFPDKACRTFTIYYEGENEVDERPWVNEVLKKYPSLQAHFYKPSESELVNAFERSVASSEVPMTGSSPVSQYFVMKLAKDHGMKVLLDGQGSDEFLAGYMHSFYRLIGGKLRRLNFVSALRELNAHSGAQEMGMGKTTDVLMKSMMSAFFSEQSLYSMEYKYYYPFLGSERSAPFRLKSINAGPLKRFLYHLLFNTSLPSLLHYEDRNSMAFSIESRVPFLDHRLVEYSFALADDELISRGETKRILRRGLAGTLPEAIVSRKDKKGFVTPGEIKWLRGPLSFLLETDFINLEHLNRGKIKNLISEFRKGGNRNANLVWRIAVLDYWMRENC